MELSTIVTAIKRYISSNWLAIITAIAAICGAYASIRNLLNNRRRLSITFSDTEIQGDKAIAVTIENPSDKTILMDETPKLKPQDARCIFPMPIYRRYSPIPQALKPEDPLIRFWFKKGELAEKLNEKGYSGTVKLSAEVKGRSGKIYRAKKLLEFNVDDWLKSEPQM